MARRRLDLSAGAPRHPDGAASVGARDRRTRERQRSFEARRTVFQPERAIDFDRERAIGRIETEAQLDATIVAGAARCQPIAVTLARGDEPALAFRRAEQRAQLSVEPEALKRNGRAACSRSGR